MIRGTTKTTMKGGGLLQKLQGIAKGTHGSYVTVGVHKGEGTYQTEGGAVVDVAQVALWNEFGTVNAPERSFLRSTLNEEGTSLAKWRIEALRNMSSKGWSVRDGLGMVGFRLAEKIKNKIKSNVPPPNAPATVAIKKAAGVAPRTLIETGLLLRSVQYRVYVPASSGSGASGDE